MPQTVITTDLHAQQMNPMNHAPYKRSRGEKQLLKLISDVVHPYSQDQSPSEKARADTRRYMDEEPVDEHPLLWWKKNCSQYTVLAKKYLAIAAISVSAEWAFSTAGNTVNQNRACLLSENVNILVFLAENLQQICTVSIVCMHVFLNIFGS